MLKAKDLSQTKNTQDTSPLSKYAERFKATKKKADKFTDGFIKGLQHATNKETSL